MTMTKLTSNSQLINENSNDILNNMTSRNTKEEILKALKPSE